MTHVVVDGKDGRADARPQSLCIASFNVHMFMDQAWRHNGQRVCQVLQSLDADVVCLQEATFPSPAQTDSNRSGMFATSQGNPDTKETQLYAIAAACGMHSFDFVEADSWDNGLALFEGVPKGWVQEWENGSISTIRRWQRLRLDIPGHGLLDIYNTHLDHMTEENRLEEVHRLLETMEGKSGDQVPYIVVGDFNALRRQDYSEEEWDTIKEIRSRNSISAPCFEVVDVLSDKLVDCFRVRQESMEEPTSSVMARDWVLDPGPPLLPAPPPFPRGVGIFLPHATNWAGTRIDYAWVSPNWKLPLRSRQVVCDHSSDHFPLLLQFALPRDALSSKDESP